MQTVDIEGVFLEVAHIAAPAGADAAQAPLGRCVQGIKTVGGLYQCGQ